MVEQSGNRAYLSLGSNIEPERYLAAAVERLAQHGRVRAVSSVWESAPIGYTEQANFLNVAVLLETALPVDSLRQDVIPQIERDLGRVRKPNKNAPRTIDIDIMLYNRDVMQLGRRHIPDAEVLERPFVAIPLAEIDPDYVHPETGQTLREIAATFADAVKRMRRRSDITLERMQVR